MTLPTPDNRPGAFADLINRLYSLLTERVLTSDMLRQHLDTLQAQCEAEIDRWVELLHIVEVLKTVHSLLVKGTNLQW